MLGPAISDRTVGIEPEVCGEVEGIEACGTKAGATGGVAGGAEETGGDTGETGAGGPPACSAIGVSPDEGYHHLARPRLTPEEEGGKLEAWPAIAQR